MTTSLSQREGEPSAYQLARGTWPHAILSRASLDLPMDPSAVAAARRAVEQHLGPAGRADESAVVKLLVSELVTNAVRHGGAPDIVLRLAVAAECIRVEVTDGGPGFQRAATPMPHSSGSGGWGLFMVNIEASRWGVATEHGSCVWFEVDRPAGTQSR